MGLIWINEVSVSFGGPRLLDGATLQIEAGERIGLLGRNGSGKSTLMKLLMGDIKPDTGEIVRSAEVRIAMLPQDVPDDLPGTVYDVVASGGREHLDLLREYHDLTLQMSRDRDEGLLKKLERLQHRLETSGAWLYHQRVETVIARDRVGWECRVPGIIGGDEAPGLSGQGPGERAGSAAPGRAHKPSGHQRHPLARGFPPEVRKDPHARDP